MPSPIEDQNEVAEEVKEVKRGRGRPRKSDKPKVEKKSSGPPAKRGRKPAAASEKKGAKAKKPPASESEEEDDDATAVSENSDSGSESGPAPAPAPAPAKRGRGRPPGKAAKKASKETKDDDEDEETEPEPAVPEKKSRGKKTEGRNGNTEGSEEDETTPAKDSSEGGIKLIVEHCKSCHTYRDRAVDIVDALVAKWPKLEVEYNPKPRKGSFDFNVFLEDGSEVNLYTGVNLGPPRKLKFPDPSVVVKAMEDAYVPE